MLGKEIAHGLEDERQCFRLVHASKIQKDKCNRSMPVNQSVLDACVIRLLRRLPRLTQRVDAHFGEQWKQFEEDLGGHQRVAECGMRERDLFKALGDDFNPYDSGWGISADSNSVSAPAARSAPVVFSFSCRKRISNALVRPARCPARAHETQAADRSSAADHHFRRDAMNRSTPRRLNGPDRPAARSIHLRKFAVDQPRGPIWMIIAGRRIQSGRFNVKAVRYGSLTRNRS